MNCLIEFRSVGVDDPLDE